MAANRIAAGVSRDPDPEAAVAEALEAIGAGAEPPDLCTVFAGAPHVAGSERIVDAVAGQLRPRRLIGCGAGGVVASGREIENGPGVVVWAAWLPGAEIDAWALEGPPGTLPEDLDGLPDDAPAPDASIVVCDPYTFAADSLLQRLNETWPGRPALGGLASAALEGSARLYLDDEVLEGGAVLCALRGVDVVPFVSQGAMPVGPEIAITAAEGNVISELAFKPAIEKLGEVVAGLGPAERAQAASGMLVGVVIDENQPEHERGDFLVRPIVGADRESGAIAIGELVRVGQTVRLHVRDADSADADLRDALEAQVGALGDAGAAGALLFTCNGRGSNMFGGSDHDAAALDGALGAPVGGFFCAGEIGPVGGRNFLHGFTATAAVFAAE